MANGQDLPVHEEDLLLVQEQDLLQVQEQDLLLVQEGTGPNGPRD